MAGGAPLAELLAECQDTVDHITLEEFTAFDPTELVLLELPQPWKEGHRYRCFARSSLLSYAVATGSHMGAQEECGTLRVLTSTYLPGVDLEHRDLEFLVRSLERKPLDGPAVFRVASVVEVPASRVNSSQGVAAHVHELAEALWERELWSLFDRAVMPTTTTCPSRHPLRQQMRQENSAFTDPRSLVICDNCERTLVGMTHYRCARNCDFDLCQDCYGHSEGLEQSDRVDWLTRMLEDFWAEHKDFALPASPPRRDVRSTHLSPAVTKWNGFTLAKQEDVLRLRQCFLASLDMHGMDTGSLRPAFWPGCCVQLDRVERYARRTLQGQLDGRISARALLPHARQLLPQLGPAWGEALAVELLAAVLSERGGGRSPSAAAGRFAGRGAVWRCWSQLWPLAAIVANRLGGPLLQAVMRAPWWHLSAAAAGLLLCSALSRVGHAA